MLFKLIWQFIFVFIFHSYKVMSKMKSVIQKCTYTDILGWWFWKNWIVTVSRQQYNSLKCPFTGWGMKIWIWHTKEDKQANVPCMNVEKMEVKYIFLDKLSPSLKEVEKNTFTLTKKLLIWTSRCENTVCHERIPNGLKLIFLPIFLSFAFTSNVVVNSLCIWWFLLLPAYLWNRSLEVELLS